MTEPTPPLTTPPGRGGWHDEWHVWGDPSVVIDGELHKAELFDNVFDSRDPRHPGLEAQVMARAFVRGAYALARTPWRDGPHIRHRRVYTGPWEDVDPRIPNRRVAADAVNTAVEAPAPTERAVNL